MMAGKGKQKSLSKSIENGIASSLRSRKKRKTQESNSALGVDTGKEIVWEPYDAETLKSIAEIASTLTTRGVCMPSGDTFDAGCELVRKFRLDGLTKKEWGLTWREMVAEYILYKKGRLQNCRMSRVEITKEAIGKLYNLPAGEIVNKNLRGDEFLLYFKWRGDVDTSVTCLESIDREFTGMVKILTPILNPTKGSSVPKCFGNAFAIAFNKLADVNTEADPADGLDWALHLTKRILSMEKLLLKKSLSENSVTFFGPFLFHILESLGLLTPSEQKMVDDVRNINRVCGNNASSNLPELNAGRSIASPSSMECGVGTASLTNFSESPLSRLAAEHVRETAEQTGRGSSPEIGRQTPGEDLRKALETSVLGVSDRDLSEACALKRSAGEALQELSNENLRQTSDLTRMEALEREPNCSDFGEGGMVLQSSEASLRNEREASDRCYLKQLDGGSEDHGIPDGESIDCNKEKQAGEEEELLLSDHVQPLIVDEDDATENNRRGTGGVDKGRLMDNAERIVADDRRDNTRTKRQLLQLEDDNGADQQFKGKSTADISLSLESEASLISEDTMDTRPASQIIADQFKILQSVIEEQAARVHQLRFHQLTALLADTKNEVNESKQMMARLEQEAALQNNENKQIIARLEQEAALRNNENKQTIEKLEQEAALQKNENKQIIARLEQEAALRNNEIQRLSADLLVSNFREKELQKSLHSWMGAVPNSEPSFPSRFQSEASNK